MNPQRITFGKFSSSKIDSNIKPRKLRLNGLLVDILGTQSVKSGEAILHRGPPKYQIITNNVTDYSTIYINQV